MHHLQRILKRTRNFHKHSVFVTINNVRIMTDQDMASSATNTDGVKVIKEGKAEVLFPGTVFYNPVQEFNRDLTISVISEYAKDHFSLFKDTKECKNFAKNKDDIVIPDLDTLEAGVKYDNGLRILEGLAASGLRSVRFAKEIPGIKEIFTNDLDPVAVDFINQNIEKNGVGHLMQSTCTDASMLMYQNKKYGERFDVIDLDPYGSPAQFLDSSVQAVRDGGLLCITCTDMAVMSGNNGETAYTKYGSMAIRTKCCHEMALRIVLQSLQSHAARYGRYIEPLFSISVDFYIRVFVKVFTGQAKAKLSASKMAMMYHCTGCQSFLTQRLGATEPTKDGNVKHVASRGPPVGPTCEHCNGKHVIAGPFWADPIHDRDFVQRVITRVSEEQNVKTSARIEGMLNVISEELPDVPLYYTIDNLCSTIHCNAPTLVTFRSALMNAGYRVSMSHAAKNSLKTDAPNSVIWDVLRAWVADGNPVSQKRLNPGAPVTVILSKKPSIEVNFEEVKDANPESRQKKLLRWQPNPEKNWGPKPRAIRNKDGETMVEKRLKLQGKRKKEKQDEVENSDNKKLNTS